MKKMEKVDYTRTTIGVGVILLLFMAFYFFWPSGDSSISTTSYNEFIALLENKIESVELVTAQKGNGLYELTASIKDDPEIHKASILEEDIGTLTEWHKKHPHIVFKPLEAKKPPLWEKFLHIILIIVIFVIILRFLGKRMPGAQSNQFTKSKARTHDSPVRFTDVAGIDEAMEEVTEIVEFLKEEEKFTAVGARIPKGVILMGNPGTGKTLLAKAIAGEAGVPFFEISGSEFVEMFVGVGAGRVRDLFAQAKENTPCIIFVDEIDAMGKQRGAGVGQTHNEGEQTLNQLFVEMDGFQFNQGIVVIAATNRPDTLDTALLRPGRFDRHVVIDMPNVKGREEVLKIYIDKIKAAKDVDLNKLARGTPGYSPAQIEKIVNEAAILAARQNKKNVGMEQLWAAKEREDMGLERRSNIDKETRKITAFHEAGHALISVLVPGQPLNKVTITPRGKTMGHTNLVPKDEQYFQTKEFLLAQIKIFLGGRMAEEIEFGKEKITTGAHGDLVAITRIARQMVAELGMSEKLPLRIFDEHHEMTFLGRDIGRKRDYSEAMAQKLDKATEEIINDCKADVEKMLKQKEKELRKIAELLLEKETITGDDVRKIVGV